MAYRVAINGFGRIGRSFVRAVVAGGVPVEIVAINDLTSPSVNAHLLERDSTQGRFPGEVRIDGDDLVAANQRMRVLSERDPAALPWSELGVDCVVESTGIFTDGEFFFEPLNPNGWPRLQANLCWAAISFRASLWCSSVCCSCLQPAQLLQCLW